MAGAALQPVLVGEAAHRSGDPVIDKAMDYLDANIANAELAPAQLEKHLGVSRSSLYRIFEPLGGVGAVILRRRLDRSMKALVTGVSAKPPLRAIASSHGFRSEAYFSRAFRARFGVTPRAFHDMVRRKDHAGLSAQAQRAGFTSLQAWLDDVSREGTG